MISGTLPRLGIVVLAAGFSARLGQPKALAKIGGVGLLQRTLAVLAPFAAACRIVVVVPPRCARYRGPYRAPGVFVPNRERARGLSSSVHRGIRRSGYAAAVLLLPVDLAELTARDVGRLISRWRGARRKIVARDAQGRPVAPLILPRWLYARALRVEGDQGLRDWVRGLPREHLILEALPSAEADVDTPKQLALARRRARPPRRI